MRGIVKEVGVDLESIIRVTFFFWSLYAFPPKGALGYEAYSSDYRYRYRLVCYGSIALIDLTIRHEQVEKPLTYILLDFTVFFPLWAFLHSLPS